MSNSNTNLIVRLYSNYTEQYYVSIANLDLDRAKNLLM